MRVLLVGGGAREHAIGAALVTAGAQLLVAAPWTNPGLTRIATSFKIVDPTQGSDLVALAKSERAEYAVIGPEAPLAAGVADALREAEIPVVGPSRSGARIESSKRFCRDLLARHQIELPRGEETILVPLVEALQAEEKVVEARYYIGHPFLDRPSLFLRTKGEKPQQVLKRVLKDLSDLYGDALQDFEKKADKVKA